MNYWGYQVYFHIVFYYGYAIQATRYLSEYIGLVFSSRYLNNFYYPPCPLVTGTYYQLPAILAILIGLRGFGVCTINYLLTYRVKGL